MQVAFQHRLPALGQRQRPLSDLPAVFASFWTCGQLRDELVDLLDVLHERTRLDSRPMDVVGPLPLHTHATYGLYEIIAGYGLVSNGVLRETREGVVWAEAAATDFFLPTLNKSEKDYSPTTRYDDYPISPTLFHWESQSRTAAASATGRRYVNHVARGSRVILFVREDRDDDRGVSSPYLCLGPARYVSHRSERPMQIVWELERPMPASIYEHAKVAAG